MVSHLISRSVQPGETAGIAVYPESDNFVFVMGSVIGIDGCADAM